MPRTTIAPPLPELVAFLETLPEPHILCDRDYRILAANAAYRAQCAGKRDVVGRTCYEVSHHYPAPCDQSGESCPLARAQVSGRREHVLHLHHTPSGETYESIELSPIADAGGRIAFFVEKLQPLAVARGADRAPRLVGRSPAFLRLMDLVARVAPSSAAVLLQGESGSGKELVAQAIHDASPRAKHPFVVVDCSGLPESLIESELFGHERGAFTGATARQQGLIEAASGGTLFLDEAGDIPQSMQVKLLRLLETGTYRRVGGTEWRRADIRLVSATHRDLRAMVGDGRFRQDLFYRLNAFPIAVPPLRERREDLPELIATLLDRVAHGRTMAVAPDALALLAAYPYPGNVRELRNLLERATLMSDDDTIAARHLPDEVTAPGGRLPDASDRPGRSGASTEAMALKDAGREALRGIVARHKGSRRELARRLGISERTLYRRIRELGG